MNKIDASPWNKIDQLVLRESALPEEERYKIVEVITGYILDKNIEYYDRVAFINLLGILGEYFLIVNSIPDYDAIIGSLLYIEALSAEMSSLSQEIVRKIEKTKESFESSI